MKKMLLIISILIISLILYVGGMIAFGYITKYRPAATEKLQTVPATSAKSNAAVIADSSISFCIWNIGYGALGADVDFFYDGGKMVISKKELVEKYSKGIFDFASQTREVDFFLFQEVDQKGKRSHNIDQVKGLQEALPDHNSTFAVNYDVKYLPFPWTEPLGRIYSGVLSMSKFQPVESQRIALPNITDFPRRLFYLQRCMLMQRFKMENGKDLIVFNTHFEAYDKGEVKKAQMKLAKKYLDEEYAKGNYVVVGGDWNIAPAGFNVRKWEKEPEDEPLYLANNDPEYMKGWQVVYDSTVATNRKNKTSFSKEKTFTTVIDYYLVSPNLQVEEVKGIDLGFANSDHQPVKLKVKLL